MRLRASNERPSGGHAADQRNKFPSLHHPPSGHWRDKVRI
jgi:hypothetical protein